MDNKEILKGILSDLFQIDPSFREIEKELSALVSELIKNKPEVMLNESFKQELKAKVLAKARELKIQKEPKKQAGFSWKAALRPVAYVSAGVVVSLLVALPLMLSKNNPSQISLGDAFNFKAQDIGAKGFGSLAFSSNTPSPEGASSQTGQGNISQDTANQALYGMGGGVGGGVATSPMAPEREMMPPYKMQNIIYVYKGAPVELSESQLKVYKRANEDNQASQIGKMFSSLKWQGLDLGKFSSLLAQYVTLKESGNPGYSITLNFTDGMVSINEDMGMATIMPVDNLGQQKSISDLPKDEAVIATANSFLAKYGINKSNYGAPEVQKQWILRGCAMADNTRCYIPSTLSVLYPMLVNGQEVYDQGGGKVGMSVSVDVDRNKVTGLWNLKTQNYQASFYDAVTDFNKILESIQKMYQPYYYGPSDGSSETIEVELSEPQIVYETITRYQKGRVEEFLVPALLFPIKEGQTSQYYYPPENIVVPLITEMLDFQNQGPYPVPYPAPMMEGVQVQTK